MKLEQTQGGAFKLSPLSAEESARAKGAEKASALKYLADTDWYYARLAETGEAVPNDVKTKRIACRELLNA